MTRAKKIFLTAVIVLGVAANTQASISLNGGVHDLGGYTEGLSENNGMNGNISVSGVNYITNGTLLLHPGTTLVLEPDAGLVFVSYGDNNRKAGQLLALGGVDIGQNVDIQARVNGTTRGLMFLGRDAIQVESGDNQTNLCEEGFGGIGGQCDKTATVNGQEVNLIDYFNYGSLNPSNYRNDSCGILTNVNLIGLGNNENDSNAITLGGCGKGTLLQNVAIDQSGDDSIELFGGDVTLQYPFVKNAGDDGIDWDANYLGWLLDPLVDISSASSYEGSNPDNITQGPIICATTNISANAGEDAITLKSGYVYINDQSLINGTVGGAASANVRTLPNNNLDFAVNCPAIS